MDTLAHQLGNQNAAGSYTLDCSPEDLRSAIENAGFALFDTDLKGVKGKQNLLNALAAAAGFPPEFGANWMPLPTRCATCPGARRTDTCCCCEAPATRWVFPPTTGKSRWTSSPTRWCTGGSATSRSGYSFPDLISSAILRWLPHSLLIVQRRHVTGKASRLREPLLGRSSRTGGLRPQRLGTASALPASLTRCRLVSPSN